MLKDDSRLFVKGYYASLIEFAWHIFCIIIGYSVFANRIGFVIGLSAAGAVIRAVMLYYTLYGLAEMADAQTLYLAGKLQSAFFAYIFSAISVFAGILLAPIFVVFWIFSFILYIYILSKVRSAYKKIRETHTAKYIQPRKIGGLVLQAV